jgi:hypothetical protein
MLGLSLVPIGATNVGIGFGAAGASGGVDNNVTAAAGDIRVAGSVRVGLGIVSGNYPWTFNPGLYVRANADGVISVGVDADPSTDHARLVLEACSTTTDQLLLRPGGAAVPTVRRNGGLSYDGSRVAFSLGSTLTNVGLKLPDVDYTPLAVSANSTADQGNRCTSDVLPPRRVTPEDRTRGDALSPAAASLQPAAA